MRKDKRSGAMQYLQVDKLSKDVGVLYLSSEPTSYIKDCQVRVLFKNNARAERTMSSIFGPGGLVQYRKFFVHCTFSSCVLTKHSQQSLTLKYRFIAEEINSATFLKGYVVRNPRLTQSLRNCVKLHVL